MFLPRLTSSKLAGEGTLLVFNRQKNAIYGMTSPTREYDCHDIFHSGLTIFVKCPKAHGHEWTHTLCGQLLAMASNVPDCEMA